MKKALNNLLDLIIEILILIIGVFVFLPLGFFGIIYTFIKHIKSFDYSISKQLVPIIRSVTLLFDGFANAGSGELFNDLIKDNTNVRYGKWYHTISAITGIKKQKGNDTKFRRVLDKVLGKNHCEEAITPEQKAYYK